VSVDDRVWRAEGLTAVGRAKGRRNWPIPVGEEAGRTPEERRQKTYDLVHALNQLSDTQRTVLDALIRFHQRHEVGLPSLRSLAADTGLHFTTVSQAADALTEAGYCARPLDSQQRRAIELLPPWRPSRATRKATPPAVTPAESETRP
jgi:hypothetical protein